MITDGTGDLLGLHRPGRRIASGGDEHDARVRDSQRKLIERSARRIFGSKNDSFRDDRG